MKSQNIYLPNYSVGEDCYQEIPFLTRNYGSKAVVIGGKTAMEKAKDALIKGIEGSRVELLGFLWYGGDSTMENVEKLRREELVQKADMLFAVGGGRACDTVKTLGDLLDKPVFTFPTLASNCAACTNLSVIYNTDGSFRQYYYQKQPACHTFINTRIIAESPYEMFWAGIGDALSKEYEVVFACRGKKCTICRCWVWGFQKPAPLRCLPSAAGRCRTAKTNGFRSSWSRSLWILSF